ncbi:MAG: TIGR04282 family arsenosugar biosynthesis glycosyltransferase [Luteolibacter sp.]
MEPESTVSLSSSQLIVFTRLPCEGRNKTRLIPALGAAGAARFHDRLARHTISRAQDFCKSSGVQLVIRLDGGTPADGIEWLGNFDFKEQGNGDLGERLDRAVTAAFDEGAQRVLVIGTDCPELDQATLTSAFDTLIQYPVVLGPAYDGGYYLIGLSTPAPAMFQNIEWGTSHVFAQSLAAAGTAGLTVGKLRFLADVDLPDDLPAAEIAFKANSSSTL